LDSLQELVGGYCEAVPLPFPHLSLIVNEDGRQLRLLPNPAASRLAGQPIVGVALVIRYDEEGDEVDLTDEDIAALRRPG